MKLNKLEENRIFWLRELKKNKSDLGFAMSKDSRYLREKAYARLKYTKKVVEVNGYEIDNRRL